MVLVKNICFDLGNSRRSLNDGPSELHWQLILVVSTTEDISKSSWRYWLWSSLLWAGICRWFARLLWHITWVQCGVNSCPSYWRSVVSSWNTVAGIHVRPLQCCKYKDICSQYFIDHPAIISGQGIKIEIDGSKFEWRKYNRERYMCMLTSLTLGIWWNRAYNRGELSGGSYQREM